MKEITQGELLLYQDENVWLTQAQLVTLYQSSKANISEHIKHIFEEGELEEKATVRKFRTVQKKHTNSYSEFPNNCCRTSKPSKSY